MNVNFHIRSEANVLVISFSGKIDHSTDTTAFFELLQTELKKEQAFLYDLSALEYVSSSGLNFFIRSLTRVRNEGRELYFSSPNTIVSKLFKITKLNEIFTIFPSQKEGLEIISKQIK